jgi:hypothetical protein
MKKQILIMMVFVFIFTILVPTSIGMTKGQTLEELQKKITALTKEVKDLKNKLVTKTKEADKLKKEKTILENQIKDKDSTIKSKNSIIKGKDTEIKKLKDLIEQKNQEMEEQKRLNKLSNAPVVYTDENLEVGTDIKWYVFNIEQATIFITPKAYDKYWFLIDSTDKLITDITKIFGDDKLKSKAEIFIYNGDKVNSNGSEYKARYHRVYMNAAIYYPENPTNWNVFLNIYAHELVHAVQDLNLGLFSSYINQGVYWLTEGSAEYIKFYIDYTKYNFPERYIVLDEPNIQRYSDTIRLSASRNGIDLSSFKTLPKVEEFHRDYGIFASLNYFMDNYYGRSKYIEFIENHKTLSVPDAIKKTFGVSEEHFISEWKKYFSI